MNKKILGTGIIAAAMGAVIYAGSASSAFIASPLGNINLSVDLGRAELSKTACLSKDRPSVPEDYIIGVVAAEMPASYGEEALKAQAVAARTYALRALEENPTLTDLRQIGQAYITKEEMREKWGENFDLYYSKIRKAVNSTAGMIQTYEGEPILAVFCASSGGVTESSEEVWGQALPYLTAVDSHWDKGETQTIKYSSDEIISLLGGMPEIQTGTPSGYVEYARVGDKRLTGTEIRSLLGLPSANFEIARDGDKVYFIVSGHGHGVGMSQKGAEAMAAEGSSCAEILSHYYPGTEPARIK